MKILHTILISIGGIVGILLLAIFIYRFIQFRKNNPVLIPKQMDARTVYRFPRSKFRLSEINGGLEYSFNFWMFVGDMDYRYGQEKIICFWKGKSVPSRAICKHEQLPDTTVSMSKRDAEIKENCPFCQDARPLGPEPFIGSYQGEQTTWEHFSDVSPKAYSGIIIALASKNNDLLVHHSLLDGTTETLTIPKIPIQKWLHVVVILKQRHLDVFINGKLINSRHLRSIPIYHPARLSVTPNGGFSGFISRFQYHNHSLNIQEVRHYFNRGPPTDLESHVATTTSSRIMEDVGYSQ